MIFIVSTKSILKEKGQSSIAAAAYCASDKLFDKNKDHGKLHDYEKCSGVLSADIIFLSALTDIEIGRA